VHLSCVIDAGFGGNLCLFLANDDVSVTGAGRRGRLAWRSAAGGRLAQR
jgi:hypothetical protein